VQGVRVASGSGVIRRKEWVVRKSTGFLAAHEASAVADQARDPHRQHLSTEEQKPPTTNSMLPNASEGRLGVQLRH
jgi:hypothetical protein